MTVKELKKALRGYDDNVQVYVVGDWEQVEDGVLTDLLDIHSVLDQKIIIDMGINFDDETQVLIEAIKL